MALPKRNMWKLLCVYKNNIINLFLKIFTTFELYTFVWIKIDRNKMNKRKIKYIWK